MVGGVIEVTLGDYKLNRFWAYAEITCTGSAETALARASIRTSDGNSSDGDRWRLTYKGLEASRGKNRNLAGFHETETCETV